jgi:hypothetical protein
VIWLKVRQYWKVALGALLVLLAALAWVLVKMLSAGKAQAAGGDGALTRAVVAAREQISHANAQAAVEVAVARTKDTAIKSELNEVMAVKAGAERRTRLAELGRKVGL